MKRTIIVLVALILSLFSFSFLIAGQEPPPQDPTDQLPPISKKLQIDVIYDGSLSMLGFVSPGDFTNYAKTLQIIQDTAIIGSSGGQATFSKFGSQIYPLSEPEVSKAVKPYFYNQPATRIDKVIDNANENDLTVIVTDLFQNEADTSLLISKIKDKYLSSGLAVGIAGVRSKFSGRVYDIGDLNFNYNGFRPFYMVLLGKHADIANFYELLRHNGLNKFKTQFVIFSPYIVNPLPSFADAKFESMKKMVEVNSILQTNVKDNRVRQFRIKADTSSFRIALEPKSLPYTLSYDSKQLEPDITSGKYNHHKLIPIGQDNNLIDVRNFSTVKNKLVFDTEFHLADKGVYRFDITVSPKFSAFKNLSWFSEWDMKTDRITEWHNNPSEFDGSTTFNLERLLSGLGQANWQMNKPKVAHFFCYVEKR